MISKHDEECLPYFLINDLDKSFSLTQSEDSCELKSVHTNDYLSSSSSSFLSFQSQGRLSKSMFPMNYMVYLTTPRDAIILQKIIQSMINEELNNVIYSLRGNIVYLMKEQNGNYFISDLLKKCTYFQRKIIYEEISFQFYNLCFDPFGTHSIQTLIEVSNLNEEKMNILQLLFSKENNIKLINDKNGTYVIQKILMNIDESLRIDINNLIIEHFNTFAYDVNGVCVIKKVIISNHSPYYRSVILSQIMKSFNQLAKDKYGNYIIQELLHSNWGRNDINPLLYYICSNFVELASNRSSSHIAELFISKLDKINRKLFFSQLLLSEQLVMLGRCRYGVFVLNRILSFYDINERNNVIQILQKQSRILIKLKLTTNS